MGRKNPACHPELCGGKAAELTLILSPPFNDLCSSQKIPEADVSSSVPHSARLSSPLVIIFKTFFLYLPPPVHELWRPNPSEALRWEGVFTEAVYKFARAKGTPGSLRIKAPQMKK